MIKSGAYIQILEFFSKQKNFGILNNYTNMFENLHIMEALKRFDEIRIVHGKYKSQCDLWKIYPNMHLNNGLDKLNGLKADLTEICKQFKIRVVFYDKKSNAFKYGIHASYWIDQMDITDLIVFSKERKESSVSCFDSDIMI